MASPLTPFSNPEDVDYDEEAQTIQEYYSSIKAVDIDPTDFMPAGEPLRSQAATWSDVAGDVANMVFGDEMNAVGIYADKTGWEFNLERAKDFWAEHPVRAVLGFASMAAPVAGLAARGARSVRLAGIGDDLLVQGGFVESAEDLVSMSAKDKELLKINYDHIARYRDRMKVVEDAGGPQNVGMKDKAFYYFNKWFANDYMMKTDPEKLFDLQADWRQRVSKLYAEKGEMTYHLRDLPPDEIAPQIGNYLVDAEALDKIPKKWQPWAMRITDDLRSTQAQAVKEGMIAEDEAAAIGDVWFSTTREGTKRDMGDVTTILDYAGDGRLRTLTVPKTTSPNLLSRATSKEELQTLVQKQSARQLLSEGKVREAVTLLGDNPGFADAKGLIAKNEINKAIQLLSTDSQIDFTPKSIVFNSVFNQKLLLENFRMLRDLALNPDVSKKADYIAALPAGAKRNWMNLDSLDGSDRIRRMVAIARGKNPLETEALGYVPKSVFNEIKDLTDGSHVTRMTDLMTLMTAVYKTAKTAFNIPTHFSNTIGNVALLMNAGVNPLRGEFPDLIKSSASAVAQYLKIKRGKAPEAVIKGLGAVPSKIGKGMIDIAQEFGSKELQDTLEFTNMMNNDATMEGIGVIERLSKTNNVTGYLAQMMNKGIEATKAYIPSDIYMAEDAIPKAAYFLHLRQRGFSRAAAAMEVGRRMPMYQGVGDFAQSARGWAVPWVTFPVEIARIMKNNMIDHPFKTAMMMQMPGLAQVGAYSAAGMMGRPQTPEGIAERKEQLPGWANRPSTIMTPIMDKNHDFRAMTMDFLPYTAVMPPSVSSDVPLTKQLPLGLDEPMPILSGLWMAMTGRDSWGQEIPTDPNAPSQKVKMMALNLMGFLSPPIMDRYLFDPTAAKFGYKFLQETGKALNPYTEKAGDPTFDFFVNNFSGVKMYAASPEQQLANESFVRSNIQDYRGLLSRQWSALLKSGDTQNAAGKMQEIAKTFSAEYKDPAVAHRKMIDWMKSHTKAMKTHPQLRNFTKEELRYMLSKLENQGVNARTTAMRDLIETYRRELKRRGRDSAGGKKNPFAPMPSGSGGDRFAQGIF